MTLADETAPEIAAHIKNALSVIHPEVSKFTFPLFAVDQRGRPVLYASSVLVTIDETVVLLTAAHAVHEITRTGSDLYLGAKTITSIKTAFVCTSKNGRDALDLAATLIPDELLRTDAMHSLPQSKLCTPPYSLPLHIRCVHGYPVTKNKTRKRANESTNVFTKYSFTYAGAPHNVIDDYARYSKRDSEHIALKYQRQSRNDLSELVTPPSPKGISGGGLWPGRAKEEARLLADKLPFAELKDGKFRQYLHWPLLAGCCLIILDIYLIIRNRTGIAQDKLGVMIGMDESCSSARMSRYETGIHEPPIAIAGKIAHALNLPLLYFYCDGEQLAEILLYYATFNARKKAELLDFAKKSSQSD